MECTTHFLSPQVEEELATADRDHAEKMEKLRRCEAQLQAALRPLRAQYRQIQAKMQERKAEAERCANAREHARESHPR